MQSRRHLLEITGALALATLAGCLEESGREEYEEGVALVNEAVELAAENGSTETIHDRLDQAEPLLETAAEEGDGEIESRAEDALVTVTYLRQQASMHARYEAYRSCVVARADQVVTWRETAVDLEPCRAHLDAAATHHEAMVEAAADQPADEDRTDSLDADAALIAAERDLLAGIAALRDGIETYQTATSHLEDWAFEQATTAIDSTREHFRTAASTLEPLTTHDAPGLRSDAERLHCEAERSLESLEHLETAAAAGQDGSMLAVDESVQAARDVLETGC